MNQQIPLLNQHRETGLFHWLAVNQQNNPLNQHKNANVGSAKSSNGAGWRAVNQLNQLNQRYFCIYEKKLVKVYHNKAVPGGVH
ncbi:hypothetical protein I4A70_004983 [Enterobacter cloacae]|uniref:hypothetical protein n=1 Tax=Enterobacter cloacae complex sp. TaxID=2027919 RepID=UPI00111323BB|nr:hypothetical protein [Enterobacter cloacae complex sp.]EKY1505824.1 hypothetical protein [Enterobacter cloacae]